MLIVTTVKFAVADICQLRMMGTEPVTTAPRVGLDVAIVVEFAGVTEVGTGSATLSGMSGHPPSKRFQVGEQAIRIVRALDVGE